MALHFPRKSDGLDGFRDAVCFAGEDADTQTLVACAITHEALIRCFGAQRGNRTSLLTAFRRSRAAIERIASAKYDATGRPGNVMLQPAEVEALQTMAPAAVSRSA
jgi:hypothetical protein